MSATVFFRGGAGVWWQMSGGKCPVTRTETRGAAFIFRFTTASRLRRGHFAVKANISFCQPMSICEISALDCFSEKKSNRIS